MRTIPFVFIAMGRSGTTWLCELMNRHPCVHCAGEQACGSMRLSTSLNVNPDPAASLNRWDDLLPSGAYFELGSPAMPCEQFAGRFHHADGSPWNICPPNGENSIHAFAASKPKVREKASKCEVLALGGKCQPDRDLNATNTTAFEAMLRSQTPGARVVYMVRNNSLDWLIAAGHLRGADTSAQTVDVPHFVKLLQKKREHDDKYFHAMHRAASRAGVPFLPLVYEELCANRASAHTLFQFLGVADDYDDTRNMIAELASADSDKHAKKHLRTHRQEIKNFHELEAELKKVGLERHLQDETCSVKPSPSVLLKKKSAQTLASFDGV